MRADARVYLVLDQEGQIVWLDASLKHLYENLGDTGDLKDRNEVLPFLRVGLDQEFKVGSQTYTLTCKKLGTGTPITKSEKSEKVA